jgi:hypothetical protein
MAFPPRTHLLMAEVALKRSFIFATMLWLAAFEAAYAQTTLQNSPEVSPVFPSPSFTTGMAPAVSGGTQVVSPGTTVSDPLSIPTSSILSSGSLGTVTQAPGRMNAVSSTSPQTALQLPDEASNSPTQGPITTASVPAASSAAGASAGTSSSGQLCSSSVPSTAGDLSAGSLAGGISAGGC